jgi:hypothetical protein
MDPIEEMLNSLAETLASEYNETIYALVSALQAAGHTKEEINEVMTQVSDLAAGRMAENTKDNMAVLDLLFIGMLVHRYRHHFIEEKEKE